MLSINWYWDTRNPILFFFYVIYAQIHKYCILDTAVTEPSTTLKTEDTCFEIVEAEVAPDENWLDLSICFPINCLSNTRHVKFSFLLRAENTATVGSKLHVQFYPILK